jgi:hypothetical protein
MLQGKWVLGFCVAAAFVALEQSASASLQIHLYWSETYSSDLMLTPRDIGQPKLIDVYARITGQLSGPGNAETLRSVEGAFVTHGGILGTFAPAGDMDWTYTSTVAGLDPFNGAGATAGKTQDIDGDGDIDLGGKPGAPQADWVVFRTDKANYGAKAGEGTPITDGVEFLIGRVSFTLTGFGHGDPSINFVFKQNADGSIADDAALWTQDGQRFDGSTGQMIARGMYLPEPSSLWVLGLVGAAILRRRR